MNITINKDINNLKIGEVACYHFGYLPTDRNKQQKINESKLTEPTPEAVYLDSLASDIYRRSTAAWDESLSIKAYGTGEFSIYQKKFGQFKYAYYAKKIK